MTQDNGDNLYIPIATKWLVSGIDDDTLLYTYTHT